MPDLKPIYTADNCRFSAPLQWSVTIFWREPELHDEWLPQLANDFVPDGIRLLSHRFATPTSSQFALSTLPHVSPNAIVQRTKGRLYHLVRERKPQPFKGNFAIRSVGGATRHAIEDYVADQLGHHKMADPAVQARMEQYQVNCSEIDLSHMRKTSHGIYWVNLHLVLVHRERWNEVRHEVLSHVRAMVIKVAKKKAYLLSRAGILTDHVHVLLGGTFDASPLEVALSNLNNLAFVHEMKPIYQYGGYIGTVGEYTNKSY